MEKQDRERIRRGAIRRDAWLGGGMNRRHARVRVLERQEP